MLDHLTGGRLEMGVVSGIPPSSRSSGSPGSTRPKCMPNAGRAARRIAKPFVSHRGGHFSFEGVGSRRGSCSRPRRCGPPPPCRRRPAGPGERGLKMCCGFADVEKLTPVFEAYREGAKSAGCPPGRTEVQIRRQVTIVEDEAERERAAPHERESVEEFQRASFEAMKIPDAPAMHVDRDELIFGTPRPGGRRDHSPVPAAGSGQLRRHLQHLRPRRLRKTHELYSREVIPRLRAAEIG